MPVHEHAAAIMQLVSGRKRPACSGRSTRQQKDVFVLVIENTVFVNERTTVLVIGKLPRARYIAERFGETREHLDDSVVAGT
jgi:hypothetical protein